MSISKTGTVSMNLINQKDVNLMSFKKIDYNRYMMPMIIIYFNTIDYKGKYVARLWTYDSTTNKHIPTRYVCIKDTYKELKDEIPFMFTEVDPSKDDDECIMKIFL